MNDHTPREENSNATGCYASLFLSLCSIAVTFLGLLWQNRGLQFSGILLLATDVGILVYYLSTMHRPAIPATVKAKTETKAEVEAPEEESLPVLALANRVAEVLQRGAGARVHVNTALNDRCVLDIKSATDEPAVGIVLHTTDNVGVAAVRGLHSLVVNTKAERGLLFTSSTFTADAVKWAKGKSLFLIDGRTLDQMVAKYGTDAG